MSELEETYFPSWRLGLRNNPFRALAVEEWAEMVLVPEILRDRLEKLPRVMQILGASGHGKTSALYALQREFLVSGLSVMYEYIPRGARRITGDPSLYDVCLLDEAQRLAPHNLRRLLRLTKRKNEPAPRLIMSTHEDLGRFAIADGINLQAIRLEQYSYEFIKETYERRLDFFTRPGYKATRLSPAALKLAIGHCGSNLRQLEHLLYEVYQKSEVPDPIPVPAVQEMIEQLF